MIASSTFYRVEIADGETGCSHCGAGRYWTVVYTQEDGEPCEIGTSWADKELAEDVCDLMNMAYEAGREGSSSSMKSRQCRTGEMSMVKRYVWDEEGYPPDGMELVSAADYDEIAAESEARHQSCLVLMKSVQDHRERICELEALLAARPPYYCHNCRCARCGNTFIDGEP